MRVLGDDSHIKEGLPLKGKLVRVLGLILEDLVHLPNLIVLYNLSTNVTSLASPMIPVDLFIHKRLRIVPDLINRRAV